MSDLVGLGISAIADLGMAYAQNAKDAELYEERVESGRLPIVHGVERTADDVLRRDVIQGVMCNGRVDIGAIEARHQIEFTQYFAYELSNLASLVDDGLVNVSTERVQVTAPGQFFLRNIAMAFDAYAKSPGTARFSKAI